MIDFRYHVVSLVAVFLALALGILLGSSVASGPLEARLRGDLERARSTRDQARAQARDVQRELDGLDARLGQQLGPWANAGRLGGRPVVVVSEAGTDSWRDEVVARLVGAGAVRAGTLVLRNARPEGSDPAEVTQRVRAVVPTFEPGEDPLASALGLLGARLREPEGPALAAALEDLGLVALDRSGDPWPPDGAALVVSGGVHPAADARQLRTAAFARGAADWAPVLVLATRPDAGSAVSVLRAGTEGPASLVTFDSAGEDGDPGGLGVVAALLAAISSTGGDYGTAPGSRFVPEPG